MLAVVPLNVNRFISLDEPDLSFDHNGLITFRCHFAPGYLKVSPIFAEIRRD